MCIQFFIPLNIRFRFKYLIAVSCRKKQPNISISSLFDFFKKLNETPDHIKNDYDLLDIESHLINTPNMEINGQRGCVKGV